ncbi:TPA: hypothetical protein I7272_28410 [Vibrio parahaemolyticus]|uniref:metallophosphoesterase family protein n=1 Tax=Vibrio parahaemolyticus TaxID=670 RepID=UPI000FEC64E3|nr:metallophosphoesterase [Vibrio parahaemolyticus]MCX8885273.1 metallophosphoesterase [Vibrio parahaemolyticus]HAS3028943.1 metallophosphoesterase [Vibrio parahaemolyticus]HAS3030907.1 metallophosphoesterase [Vibrio parahaemolyticus]HAS3034220.1 metallophosphoesterase [Vibrio parahaemolyticus]HAS3035935.1 metallophosphoesterase [Vibrio parahaemolyticus]
MEILLLSDLHAVPEDDLNERDSSRLLLDSDIKGEYADSLISYVRSQNKKIDYIVCCGDIANKGCGESFKLGWKFLQRLKDELPGSKLLTVPGNHDHQSRASASEGFSPKHQLQFCEPTFPFDCYEKNTHFWAWNWAMVQEDEYANFLLLNTSAFHGFNDEYKHGRVSTQSVEQISSYIKSSSFEAKSLNVLICHHHPQPMEHAYNDYDGEQMSGGQSLINALQEADIGPWLVLHGHKHFACISNASSQDQSPAVVFSAGSASAKIYKEIENKTSNQIYFLSIDKNKTVEQEKVIGRFNTHEYKVGSGWRISKSENLPGKSGLGSRTSAALILKSIQELLDGTPFLDENDLEHINEELSFFTPREFERFLKRLTHADLSSEIDKSSQKVIEVGLKHE